MSRASFRIYTADAHWNTSTDSAGIMFTPRPESSKHRRRRRPRNAETRDHTLLSRIARGAPAGLPRIPKPNKNGEGQ
jgi:hypothetical protein